MAEIKPNWNSLYSNQGIRLNGNPALDDLRQRYATQQQQKAQDNANFTSQIAKLNFGGAMDADLPDLHKSYGDILNTFGKLRTTNDPKERAQLNLELQQKQNGFLYDIEKSKDANKENMEYMHLPLNPNANLAEGATDKILDLSKIPSKSKDRDKAKQDLINNLYDKPSDLPKIYADAFAGTKSTSKTTGEDIKDKTTGEFKTPTYNTTEVKKEDFANHIIKQLQGDKRKQNAVVSAYPTLTHDQAISKFIDEGYAMKQNQLGTDTTYSAPHESFGQKEALQKNAAILRMQYPGGNPAINQPTPAQTLLTNVKSGNQDAINKFLSLTPTGQYGKSVPKMVVDKNTGEQVFLFPSQVVEDKKAMAHNAIIRKDAKTDKVNVDPEDILPEQIVKHPAKTYRLNPNSPNHIADAAQMAKEQNINLSQLNQIEGIRGGHGQIDATKTLPKVINDVDYKKLPKGAKYIAPDGVTYTKY